LGGNNQQKSIIAMDKSLKIVFLFVLMCSGEQLIAQKFGYIDTEYILNKHPDYKIIQQELENISNEWRKEAQDLDKEIKDLYVLLKAEEVLLTEEMYQQRLEQIKLKEKNSQEYYNRIFGINGQYFQKQAELMQPLQSKIYDAIERVARRNNLATLFDKAAEPSAIIYTDPRHDYSEFVLDELGIEDNK
jgi:outer membrane protein